jgi:hypothetical protein
MTSSPRNSPILRSRASASNANRFTMRWENGRSVLRSSLLYRILMANFAVAAPTLARHGGRALQLERPPLAPTASFAEAAPSLIVGYRCYNYSAAATGSPKRRPLRRRLIPSFEHVTCREPMVAPMSSAISCRLFPFSTRFLICPDFLRGELFLSRHLGHSPTDAPPGI